MNTPEMPPESQLTQSPFGVPKTPKDYDLAKRKNAIKNWMWLALCAVSFFSGWYFLGHSQQSAQRRLTLDAIEGLQRDPQAVVITAESLVMRPIERTIDAVGTLHGFEEVTISSKLEGRVLKIYQDLSSIVQPGTPLLDLDATDARLALAQSQRALQAELSKWGFSSVPEESYDRNALPMVVSAKLRYDLAKSRLDRMLPLELTRSISQDDLEQAKSEARIAESEWKNQLLLANSAAAVARLRASEVEIAQQKLSDCTIKVPTPSLTEDPQSLMYAVSERLVSEGTHLRSGTEVFRLVLGKTLKLRLPIPEVHAPSIANDQPVWITTASLPEGRLGRVTTIAPSIDRATRTFMVEVEVPNQDGKCKPGGFAKARIKIGVSEGSPTVPLAAVYSMAGIHKIFLDDQGLAKEVHVVLGEQGKDWVEILSPALPISAQVITSGQRMLSDGVAIVQRQADQKTSNQAEQR
jgi:multidrug efflux pump subunit AcrA (membrane-fusion protein)